VQVQEQLKERLGKDLWMYSITLEPETDTPEVLAEYARTNGIGPGWKFLTGRPQDIMRLRKKLGFYDPEAPSDDASQHLGFLLMGNEPYGWWGTVPATAAPRQIVQLITWLKPGAKGLR
jgi:protein SCO1/2